MKYLQIPIHDTAKVIEPLDEAERGRLFSAMLSYADNGSPVTMTGNERFVWPVIKMYIDRRRRDA